MSGQRFDFVAGACVVVALAGCRPADKGEPVDSGYPDGSPVGLELGDLGGYNLVYVHVDTLRADHLPMYGYERDTLPTVAGWPWLVVDGLHGGSSWTMPSTGALLTANPPDVNGLTDDGFDAGSAFLSSRVPTVTDHLHDLGWATALYTGNVWLTGNTDLDQGFDVSTMQAKDTSRYNLQSLLDPALDWLDGVPTDQRFFLFLQPMDMHSPYWVAPEDRNHWGEADPPFDLDEPDGDTQTREIKTALAEDPEGATAALRDVYDEELVGLDGGIGRLLDALSAAGHLDDTVVVFSADHGEMLNDRGEGDVGHGRWLREDLVHNPLLVLIPGGSGGEATCVAPNEDLFPTLLESLGVAPMEGTEGASLSTACANFAVSQLWEDETHLLYLSASDGRVRLERECKDGTETAYDLVQDPQEEHPLTFDQINGGGAMRAALEAAAQRIVASWPNATCAVE